MGKNTKIEWCDHTVQFFEGCEKVAPGCKFCYAEAIEKKYGRDIWGKLKPRKWTKGGPKLIRQLNAAAEKAGRRDIVFVNDLADFFEDTDAMLIDHKNVPVNFCVSCGHIAAFAPFGLVPKDAVECCTYPAYQKLDVKELRKAAFKLFDECQSLIFLLLTKRPENIQRMWHPVAEKLRAMMQQPMPLGKVFESPMFRRNVGIGTSVSEQATADKNIPELLKCRDLSPVLFVSYEPALGPINLANIPCPIHGAGDHVCPAPDWVIIGGESGHGARPFNIQWARDMIADCKAANVPVFMKQVGANAVEHHVAYDEEGKNIWGRLEFRVQDARGGDMSEWSEGLRVREWPKFLLSRNEKSTTRGIRTSAPIAGGVSTEA